MRSTRPSVETIVGEFERKDALARLGRGETRVRRLPAWRPAANVRVGRKWRRNALKSRVQRKEKADRRSVARGARVSVRLSLRGVDMVQRLSDVGHQVLDIFEPDGQTEQIVADAVALALVG